MANHLSHSSSPYLLQHAGNPVDWYPWGAEALKKAQDEDKPIFLSIGYAACHWCHVMAHESFEDAAVAGLMNTHFVNIKVDREERPDLDGIYMSYVVAVSGQGGWPMSVFLTPEGKPFYGGTYFPPVSRHNLPAFREVLETIARLWKEDRQRLVMSSDEASEHLRKMQARALEDEKLSMQGLVQISQAVAKGYDWQNGGWGAAPKFPQPMLIEFLLRLGSRGVQASLDMTSHVLHAMAQGGMYDVLGGGFARYSVDQTWLIPHFEKMLYDNAQLSRTYLHAYQLTGRQDFRQVCEETLDFVLREMTGPQGGFYSSLDADSEGEEGKFYLWNAQEIRSALANPHDEKLFFAAYGVTENGNFEGKNILRRAMTEDELARQSGSDAATIRSRLSNIRGQLLEVRNRRVRPATDDKVLVSWNALMLAAFAEAGRVLRRVDYTQAAIRNANFILENLFPQGKLLRAWREGVANHTAYLEDHAALALGLLSLYQTHPEPRWYQAALGQIQEILNHFTDSAGGFFDTRDDHEALLYRPKEVQDNATPSGNALAATALLQLGKLEGKFEWIDRAEKMISAYLGLVRRYPTAFAQWLCAADFMLGPVYEVAIIGDAGDPATKALLEPLHETYRPRMVLAQSSYPPAAGSPSLLNDRPPIDGKSTAYVCQGFVCKQPVNTPEGLLEQVS